MKLAVVAITKEGSKLARRIGGIRGADVFVPARFFKAGEKGVKPLPDSLAHTVAYLFEKYRGIVFVMSAGIVVRMLAPHIKDKKTDPAVVVLDEKGRYVISLLSGHIGGANALAEDIAKAIGAAPVITTASDTRGIIAVDTLAQRLGCVVDDFEQAKRVTAALVNGERVAIYSPVPRARLEKKAGALPFEFCESMDALKKSGAAARIVVANETLGGIKKPVSFLSPRNIVAGMGCNRGTSLRELEGLLGRTLSSVGISPLRVKAIATIHEKHDEPGLLHLAKKLGADIKFFPKDRLLKAATPSGPSETVFKNMGVYGVCEPAAMLAARSKGLLVAKKKSKNATIAVAEARWP